MLTSPKVRDDIERLTPICKGPLREIRLSAEHVGFLSADLRQMLKTLTEMATEAEQSTRIDDVAHSVYQLNAAVVVMIMTVHEAQREARKV